MSHVKRDGKCYDLNYTIRYNDGFELLGYASTFSLMSSLAIVALFFNRKIAIGIFVIGCIFINYQVYSKRPTVINLNPDVAKEVKCPPIDFDYNQQARNINACMEENMRRICPDITKPCSESIDYSGCDVYKEYNLYVNA
jgi:hypothetical protein